MGWEKLVTTGQVEESYKILGDDVVIRLLTDGEDTEVSMAASPFANDVWTREKILTTETLIRAVKSVNGRSFCGYIPPAFSDTESERQIREKALREGREIMRQTQSPVKQLLLIKYLELRQRQEIELGAELEALGEVMKSPFSVDSGDYLKKLQNDLEKSGLMESSISAVET